LPFTNDEMGKLVEGNELNCYPWGRC